MNLSKSALLVLLCILVLGGVLRWEGMRHDMTDQGDMFGLWNPDEGLMLAGSPDPEKTYREEIRPVKIRYQLKYAQEHSFFTDLKIIFLTIFIIITKRKVAGRK